MNRKLRLLLAITLTAATTLGGSGCASRGASRTAIPAPTAFQPAFSLEELRFVLTRLFDYVRSESASAPSRDGHDGRQHVLSLGGLIGQPLTVQLPDGSYVRIRIEAGHRILLSGTPRPEDVRIKITRDKDKGYSLSIGHHPPGSLACFHLSRDGRMRDEGRFISCGTERKAARELEEDRRSFNLAR